MSLKYTSFHRHRFCFRKMVTLLYQKTKQFDYIQTSLIISRQDKRPDLVEQETGVSLQLLFTCVSSYLFDTLSWGSFICRRRFSAAAGLLWVALLLLLTWISFNKHIFHRWLSFSFFLLCSTPIWSFYGVSVKTLLLPLFLFFLGNIEVGSWLSLRYGLTSEGLTYVFVGMGFAKAVSSSAMGISHWLTSNIAGRVEVLGKWSKNWLFWRRWIDCWIIQRKMYANDSCKQLQYSALLDCIFRVHIEDDVLLKAKVL